MFDEPLGVRGTSVQRRVGTTRRFPYVYSSTRCVQTVQYTQTLVFDSVLYSNTGVQLQYSTFCCTLLSSVWAKCVARGRTGGEYEYETLSWDYLELSSELCILSEVVHCLWSSEGKRKSIAQCPMLSSLEKQHYPSRPVDSALTGGYVVRADSYITWILNIQHS